MVLRRGGASLRDGGAQLVGGLQASARPRARHGCGSPAQAVGAIPHCSGWTVVLYNARVHGMPRQHDGVSCGVFACIIAEHLIAGRRLPHSLQANIGAWRLHIAMKVWGQRRA